MNSARKITVLFGEYRPYTRERRKMGVYFLVVALRPAMKAEILLSVNDK